MYQCMRPSSLFSFKPGNKQTIKQFVLKNEKQYIGGKYTLKQN